LEQTVFLPIENPDRQAEFYSKLTQLSQRNNVFDAPLCNLYGFLWRDICVSSVQLNGRILNKVSLPLENLDGRQYSYIKVTQFSQGNNVLDTPASNFDGFLRRDTSVSST
jgi:hypothetical protein